MPTVTTKKVMLRLLDAEILLTSMIDPKYSFPPNARQIALQADSLKCSITDGMYTAEDAELIVRAAAELTSANKMYNRLTGSTYEDDHGPWPEYNDHATVQSQNDRDLVQHTARNVSESIDTTIVPSAGTIESQVDVDILGEITNTLLPILQARIPCITTVPVMNDASFPALQAGVPTVATNIAHETQYGNPKSQGKPKSDFR